MQDSGKIRSFEAGVPADEYWADRIGKPNVLRVLIGDGSDGS